MVEIREIPTSYPSGGNSTPNNVPPTAGTSTGQPNVGATPPPTVDLGELASGLWEAWDGLEYTQKQQVVIVALILCYLLYNYIFTLLLGALVYQYLAGRKPKPETFIVFFEEWFKRDYYPFIVQKLQSELDQRKKAKEMSGNYVGVMFDMMKGSLLNRTKELQAQLVFEAVKANSAPIIARDKYVYHEVSMNLGSREEPSLVTFWGVNNRWFLAPYISLDFENIAILNTLDQ